MGEAKSSLLSVPALPARLAPPLCRCVLQCTVLSSGGLAGPGLGGRRWRIVPCQFLNIVAASAAEWHTVSCFRTHLPFSLSMLSVRHSLQFPQDAKKCAYLYTYCCSICSDDVAT